MEKILVIHVKDIKEMLEYTNRNKDLIYKIIHQKIIENLDTDVEQLFLFQIYLNDYAIYIDYIIFRHEFLKSLQLALKHFEDIEDYEYCMELKKTIDLLT